MSRCTMQTEKVINHILEIIYLMTGEEYMIVKKPVPYICVPQVSGDLCPTRNSIVEIPSDSHVHLRGDAGSKLSDQPTHGLNTNGETTLLGSVFQPPAGGGHVQIKCDDIAMYLSVEEWEYLEKHKDQFKDTNMDNQPLYANLLQSAHVLDRIYNPLNPTGEAKTQLKSHGGAVISSFSQHGAQTPHSPQGGARTPLQSHGGAQTPLQFHGGAQTTLQSHGGAQTPLQSHGGAQTPLQSHGGAQTPLQSHGGAQTPLQSHGGAQTPLQSHGGAQTPLQSHGGAQTSLCSQGAGQTPLGSHNGAQTSIFSQYGVQTSIFSQYGAQTTLCTQHGSHAPLGSQHGSHAPLGLQHGSHAPLGSQHGSHAPLGSQHGSHALLGSQHGSHALLGSQHGSHTLLGSQHGSHALLGSQHGSHAPLGSQYDAQASLFQHNRIHTPACSQDTLYQGHIKDFNEDQYSPDKKVRRLEPADTHLSSIDKRNATAEGLCLSKCEVDDNSFALNKFIPNIYSSHQSPELPQLNASPDVPTRVKEEDTLEADGSCMESLTEGYLTRFSQFDQDQGQNDLGQYRGGHTGLENMEKDKSLAWDITSAVTEAGNENAFESNIECPDVTDSPQNMMGELKDSMLGFNKDVTALLINHTLNDDPFPGLFLETHIKKELTKRKCCDSEKDLQNVMTDIRGTKRHLRKDALGLVSSHCSPSPFSGVPLLTKIKKEPSPHFAYQHFAKRPARRCQNGTLRGAVRPRLGARSLKEVSCSECGKLFSCNAYLIRHQRIHTGEKPYTCLECGRSFSWVSSFITHKRTHTGEKPFPCTLCGKRFSDYSGIIKHQRIHTGEKPYSCVTCGEHFAHTYQLAKHQSTHLAKNSLT